MGNEILGVDIAAILFDAMGEGLFEVTITRDVPGARDPNNLTGGRATTPVVTQCIGFWDDISTGGRPDLQVEANDRKLTLLGDSIPPGGQPRYNDAVVVAEAAGPVGPLYVMQLLSRDPAAAVFSYLCRDRRGPDQA